LSIDYYPTVSRPDGRGGRVLSTVTVVGGAITPKPANPLARIVSGKDAAITPIVDVFVDVQRRRADPDEERRRRQATVLAEAGWPPPELVAQLGVDVAYKMLEGAAAVSLRRTLEHDPERARVRARWEQANEYSLAMSSWMALHRT
jgi:hypothetical protein